MVIHVCPAVVTVLPDRTSCQTQKHAAVQSQLEKLVSLREFAPSVDLLAGVGSFLPRQVVNEENGE